MYANPHQIVQKVCRHCGNLFDAPRYYNKEYCKASCRRAAKNARETKRSRDEAIVQGFANTPDSRFFAQINNPTPEQLSKYAELLELDATNKKPIQFTGTIPMWQPPNGIIFNQSMGVEPTEWLMFHPSMIE